MSEVTDVILTVEPADDGHVADSSFFKRATSPLGRTGNRFDWPAHAPHRAGGREAVGRLQVARLQRLGCGHAASVR